MPRSHRPVRLAITAIPKITLTLEKPESPTKSLFPVPLNFPRISHNFLNPFPLFSFSLSRYFLFPYFPLFLSLLFLSFSSFLSSSFSQASLLPVLRRPRTLPAPDPSASSLAPAPTTRPHTAGAAAIINSAARAVASNSAPPHRVAARRGHN
jgi:hypothetical protein